MTLQPNLSWAGPCAVALVNPIKKLPLSSPAQCRQTVLHSLGGSHSFTQGLGDSTSQATCLSPCPAPRVLALLHQYSDGGKGFKQHLHSIPAVLADRTQQRYRTHSWHRECSQGTWSVPCVKQRGRLWLPGTAAQHSPSILFLRCKFQQPNSKQKPWES